VLQEVIAMKSEKKCLQCGVTFTTRYRAQRYCSKKCGYLARMEAKKEQPEPPKA
jgi:hypothetical protein